MIAKNSCCAIAKNPYIHARNDARREQRIAQRVGRGIILGRPPARRPSPFSASHISFCTLHRGEPTRRRSHDTSLGLELSALERAHHFSFTAPRRRYPTRNTKSWFDSKSVHSTGRTPMVRHLSKQDRLKAPRGFDTRARDKFSRVQPSRAYTHLE